MARGIAEVAGRAPSSSSLQAEPDGRQEGQPGWLASPLSWSLPTLFLALQLADIVTTNYALAVPGIWEANPLMAFFQAKLGAAWWLPKLVVVGFICLATPLWCKRWPMIFVISYYSVIVCGNIAQL
jgi:hypothetical protein